MKKQVVSLGILTVGVMGLCLCALPGCASPRLGNALPAEYAGGLTMVTEKIADQGMLDKWLANATSNIQDPGLESYVQVTTAAGVRIVGMNGRFDMNAGGDSTRLPPGVRAELIDQLGMPISDDQREAILRLLGWNREQESPAGAGP